MSASQWPKHQPEVSPPGTAVAIAAAAAAEGEGGCGPGGPLGKLGSGEIQANDVQRLSVVDSGGLNGRRGNLETSAGAGGSGRSGDERTGLPSRPRRAFAGMPGVIHPDAQVDGGGGSWAASDPESVLRENLSLADLVSLAYMFNFTAESGVLSLGERKAVVQVIGRPAGAACWGTKVYFSAPDVVPSF